MTQQVVRAVVNFRMRNPNIRRPTQDFVFEQRGTDTLVNTASIFTQLHNFYDSTTGTSATKTVADYLSPAIDNTGTDVMHTRIYDITGKLNGTTPAGAPIAEDFFTPTHLSSAGTSNPLELACVLSYRSDYGTDPEFGAPTGNKTGRFRPRATHRGRIYIGPLNTTVNGAVTATKEYQFLTTFVTDMTALLSHLVAGPSGTSDVTQMVQWSRKAARVSPITRLDVNSEPDIRRLRGAKAPTHSWS